MIGCRRFPRQLRSRSAGVAWRIALTLVTATVLLAGAGTALAQPPVVAVFPSPNTTYAEPGSQITFRGIPAGQIGHVSVVGSSSGTHTGAIQADSDGQGGASSRARRSRPGRP